MQKNLILAAVAIFFAIAGTLGLATGSIAQTPEKKSPLGVTQSAAKSPFGIAAPSSGTVSASAPEAGIVSRAWSWLLATQQKLNRELSAAVKNVKSENPVTGLIALSSVAFLYGILHAAGPGHGKAVISSYVLANRETVRRGIALSFLSALFQALSAIIFVGILALLLNQTSIQMRETEAWTETISWALIAALGASLLYRQTKSFFAASNAKPTSAGGYVAHDHTHAHGADCGCGHSHMPAPSQLQGPWSWRKALPIALAVGIRPCTGAILVLIFALSQGILWAGVAATFAMALGTAITVSALAALAVGSRELAVSLSGNGSVWAERAQTAAGFAGSALVFVMGTAFFFASLSGGAPL